MDSDAVGVLLTRFAWVGAGLSLFMWVWVIVSVWRVEGSLHHLVARELSAITLIVLDVAVILIFWPSQFVPPPIELSAGEVRVLVAFIVGMQMMAGLWQITAPRQGRVKKNGRHR